MIPLAWPSLTASSHAVLPRGRQIITGRDKKKLTVKFPLGGSAAAAGALVKQLGGDLVGYLFILQIPELDGRSKLDGVQTVILLEE